MGREEITAVVTGLGGPQDNDRIGAYRVVRRLATSDTADVLLATAEGPMGFERTVVLKVLLQHLTSDQDSAGAFAREAAALAKLSDPAIVTLYEFSEHRGRLVMALEHIDGAPLADVLATLAEGGRSLDDKTSLYIAQRIFSALATAHRVPVIHRDVNPSNVLLSWDGEVKLTDFGFARFMGATHQSAFGIIKGSFGYMAPEQIEGGAITSRTDIYAAGILLWELLAHETAFPRGRLSEIEALTRMAEPNLTSLDELRPDLPQRLRNGVARAIRPKSEDRDVSASEMVSILRGLVPTDIGRDKLAIWLEQVRPHLATEPGLDELSAPHERVTTSHPASQRVEASTTQPVFAPPIHHPAAAVSEETTRVLAPHPPAPEPVPVVERAPLPPPAAPPPTGLPPLVAATASPTLARSKGTALLIIGLAFGCIALGAVALVFVVRQRTFGFPAVAASSTLAPNPSSTSSAVFIPTASSTPPISTTSTIVDASPDVSAEAVAPPAPPDAAPPDAAPSKPSAPPDMTILRTEGSQVGRRIFVDRRAVGQTPASVNVPCGKHELRIGSSGVARQMELPCGGELTFTDR